MKTPKKVTGKKSKMKKSRRQYMGSTSSTMIASTATERVAPTSRAKHEASPQHLLGWHPDGSVRYTVRHEAL